MGLLGILKFIMGCSGSTLLMPQGYNVKGGKVLYKPAFPNATYEIENADVKSFKTIPNVGIYKESPPIYAVDKNQVFYRGYGRPGSHGPSFEHITDRFAKDKNLVYREGEVVEGADPDTFQPKDDVFSVDKNHVFRYTYAIDNDASEFVKFNTYIVRTANVISVYDKTIPITKGVKVSYYNHSYFAIGDQVYFAEHPLEGADAVSFECLRDWTGKSKEHVYYGEKIITGADPATFALLDAPFAKDKNHVFFFERTIEGADPTTFEIVNVPFQCSRDKNAVYKEDRRIENFTAEDLVNKKHCNSCNEKQIYFQE